MWEHVSCCCTIQYIYFQCATIQNAPITISNFFPPCVDCHWCCCRCCRRSYGIQCYWFISYTWTYRYAIVYLHVALNIARISFEMEVVTGETVLSHGRLAGMCVFVCMGKKWTCNIIIKFNKIPDQIARIEFHEPRALHLPYIQASAAAIISIIVVIIGIWPSIGFYLDIIENGIILSI